MRELKDFKKSLKALENAGMMERTAKAGEALNCALEAFERFNERLEVVERRLMAAEG